MTGLSLALLLLPFGAAAGAIWVAGVQLSKQTDVHATRLHLGSALGGLLPPRWPPTCPRSPSRPAPLWAAPSALR